MSFPFSVYLACLQVLFSDNFRKSFRKLKPSDFKKLVINMLLKLASGWRPKKINVDWKCESSSYIVKQFKVKRYYVVCSIDIMKDSIYQQVLKVWDIMPMVESAKLLKRLDSIFVMYTDDFINHCNEKLFEGYVILIIFYVILIMISSMCLIYFRKMQYLQTKFKKVARDTFISLLIRLRF